MDTKTQLRRIFSFLDLNVDDTLLKKASNKTHNREKETPDIRFGQETRSLMELYGYGSQRVTKSLLKRKPINISWKKITGL